MKTIDKLKHYGVYILLAIAIITLLYVLLKRNECSRLKAGHIYKVKGSTRGVVVDKGYFYAVGGNKISKYNRKTGKVITKKLPFKHLKAGTFVNGDLVLVGEHVLVWLDPNNLELIDTMSLPQGVSCVDWAWDKWWVCDGNSVYCFNQDWVLEGYWRLPKVVIKQFSSGGVWFGEYFCISSHDKPELYILKLAADKIHAELLRTVQVCFDGHGFAFERGKGAVYAWGLRKDEGVVVRCAVDLED